MREKNKNTMRTPKDKEKIVKEYKTGKISQLEICNKYNISNSVLWSWVTKYEKSGIDGLKSKTGKSKCNHKNMGLHFRKPKNKIEELELELMKKEIEIARLKKGYMVKGVGAEKEFVTIFDKNTKQLMNISINMELNYYVNICL